VLKGAKFVKHRDS